MFDYFYMLDWRASSKPKLGKDSIWRAGITLADGSIEAPVNLATRAQAWSWFETLVESCERRNQRAVVGFDFAFAYPLGTAAALGARVGDTPWVYTWQTIAGLIRDADDNANNRFEVGAELNARIMANLGTTSGPFWGVLRAQKYPTIGPNKPKDFTALPEWRTVERLIKGCQPGWKLAYAGSVGGQALVGIAGLQGLRNQGLNFAVWPFEETTSAPVIVAETYPSHWSLKVNRYPVKDANQVEQVVRETNHQLLLDWLDDEQIPEKSLREEGWVLGVKASQD